MSAPAQASAATADPIKKYESAVMEALADQSYDFRSVLGLSQSLGLDCDLIEAILRAHSNEIRVAAVPDANGHTLYTLRSRPRKIQERLSEALAFVVGPTR